VAEASKATTVVAAAPELPIGTRRAWREIGHSVWVEPACGRRRRMSVSRLLRAIAIVVVLGACSSSDHLSAPTPTTTTTAPSNKAEPFVTLSETLHMVGGPPPGTDEPVAGTVTARERGGLGVATTTSVGPDGRFAMRLTDGIYEVTGYSPRFGDGKYPCTPGGPVTITTRPVNMVPPYVETVTVTCPVR